ncbi:SMT3/SUMO-activating complex, AOS1/RAD31 component [Trachipleistophora hominis]|uniref:SMT3/SUMO-activating complex, AOS1/RAD31 component n=1 Tax=Trachipleistophora hominis TaxID=72359 RepID=L7JWQ6_TRAHO|nr:SMT3/SUMO-activating complex, AOS1/RAD31 component [Trachipleistophora hominis]
MECPDMSLHYEKKYDRQIRIFGFTTQEKLQNMCVTLYTSTFNYISAEIIKNLVLLGVTNLKINKRAEESVLRMIPGGLQAINDKLRLVVFDDIVDVIDYSKTEDNVADEHAESLDIIIAVDYFVQNERRNSFYVCSKCYMFSDNCDHNCVETEHSIENECLLGAILVQEIVKMVSNESCQKMYRLDV